MKITRLDNDLTSYTDMCMNNHLQNAQPRSRQQAQTTEVRHFLINTMLFCKTLTKIKDKS